MSGPPFHILAKPGEISPYIIAVGDPGRAKIFSELLDDARLVNENRGLLVYTGYHRGLKITVATHGIGCPSASVVFEELGMLGAKHITRIGSAGGMREDLEIGDIVVATGAAHTRGGCGIGQYMPEACPPAAPDPILTHMIMGELEEKGVKYHAGPVFSSDAFYAEDPGFARRWSNRGVIAVEMEAAALFTLGWMRGWKTAAVLVISDNLLAEKKEYAQTIQLKDKFNTALEAVLEAYHKTAEKTIGH